MLQLENLTPHQEEVYKQIAEELRVDIRAPAGAGKTFLALKALLEVLGSEAGGQAAFVTRNEALCLHVTKWLFVRLAQRLDHETAARLVESRFFVLFSPFNNGLRRIIIDLERGCVKVGKELGKNAVASLSLVTVDEAHHIHAAGELEFIVRKYAPEAKSVRLILLSDVSQSGAIEMSQVLRKRFEINEKCSLPGIAAKTHPPTPLAQSLSPSELRNPRSSPQASRAIDPTDRCGRRDVFQGRPGMCGVARGRGPLGWNGFRVGWNESGREENRQFTSHQPTTLQTTIGPASSNLPVSDAR